MADYEVKSGVLLDLVMVLTPLSLLSFGGGPAILSGIHTEAVTVRGWLSEAEFVNLFAISRAAPGPGLMLSTLLGWKLSGWIGAMVATLALFVPSSLVFYTALKVTNAYRSRRWYRVMRQGLATVSVGLMIASCVILFRMADGGFLGALIILISLATMQLLPRIPTILLLSAGATTSIVWSGFAQLP
ncbi:chromate transporter [Ensifer sp. YR511]|uniref:chromate transporter n=1 Tax=Ensifer sp. YR511 TaxID=1855294 RepID=UPI00115FF3CA|nr:chromate transporter [Ensifer sp. YR511]